MSSISTVQTGLAAIASLPARLSHRARRAAMAGLCTAGIAIAWIVASQLTGLVWLAFVAALTGAVLAVWRLIRTQTRLRTALARAERERALMEQTLRESQKMEALGRLTNGVLHDFNNHLTVISSNVEMVIRRLDGGHDRLLRHTDAAMQGVRRAAALTRRLLSFSRQAAPEPEIVDVDRLVTGLSELLRRTLGDRIGLSVRLSGEPWFTWADINQMENALLSLAATARDQVPDGGCLTIAVSNARQDQICLSPDASLLAGDYIQVAVAASAAPVASEHWHALDDLARADLYMARVFVREAGGCLLRSDDGALRICLPRHVPPSVMTAVAARNTSGQATILVVEDDAPVRTACVGMLRTLGYQVLEAPDAMEAFRLIADHGGIDLLFTDLGLPSGVSGHALADAARNADPGIRILFTTGLECIDPPERAGAALLRKPFSAAQLAAKVQDALTVAHSMVVQGQARQSVTEISINQPR
jgi:CheY-like chemotaxis protein